MEKVKEYTNGEITVVWKPGQCIHSAKCVGGSPDVFKPNDKPWIQPENSTSEAIMKTIDQCPSGALSYYKNADGAPAAETEPAGAMKVEVVDGGPLLIHGTIEVTHVDGTVETKKRRTAICRCGKTGNNPFCDGSHNG